MSARILFLHHTAIIGGAELHLLSIARHFRETSTVVLFNDGPFRHALETAGVQTCVFPSKWAARGVRLGEPHFSVSNIAGVMRLAWLIARTDREADLVYANSPKALLVASVAHLVRRKPLIWFLHDLLDETHFAPQSIRLLVKAANRTVARVLANSRATAAAYVAAGGRHDFVRVVYDGIDAARFAEDTTNLASTRADLELNDAPLLGVFGRITPWKGQDVVIRALAHVPSVVALLVGDEEDAGYANELRGLASDLGVAKRVRFLGFREDVPQLMRIVDCIVHPAKDPEPFGRVVVEGLVARRPVIATRAGGVPEFIEDGSTGILVSPGNSEELAAAITLILSNPAEAARLANNGHARALQLFNEERMFREIEQNVNELTRRR